jgi:alkylation response protein AidB-like acyl-CoA dehydrogenase
LLVAIDDDESEQKQLQNRRTTMSVTQIKKLYEVNEIHLDRISELIAKLGPRFAERAARTDEGDLFVAENFGELKAHGLVAAGVPKELGGGGASHGDLADMLRQLGHFCGSTALAFSMHTHQVATAAWRWRHQKAPVDGLLKRVAAENIVILSSGGSDWLQGSGTATRVDGGFRINGRKIFASGAPVGDLLMTSAVYDDPQAGPSVLHFAVSMKAEGVKVLDTWRVMGMRGTASHDIELTDVFIPDSGVSLKRPQGKWHPLFHIISMIAIPLIYSVYVGIAEAARDCAVKQATKRRADGQVAYLIGGVENELTAARLALQGMIAAAATNEPDFATTNRVMIGRTLVARGVLKTVELAMEAAGGGAFYRSVGLERLFRDAQACRYHPLQEGAQRTFAGRLALGQDVDAAG